MNEYKLICKREDTIIIIKHNATSLTEQLEMLESFLKACGYYLDGTLGIVKDAE
jgi:hypothetical protein